MRGFSEARRQGDATSRTARLSVGEPIAVRESVSVPSIAPPGAALTEELIRPKPWDLGQSMVVIAGPVGANKAVLAAELESVLKPATTVAFSDHLKAVCEKLGIQRSYANLQNLGLNVIDDQGHLGYCVSTVRHAAINTPTVIVDGLRHVLAANAIRRVNRPNEAIIVYVEVSEDEQRRHLLDKGEPEERHRAILDHPVEAESRIVRYLADRIVTSHADARNIAADLKELFLHKRESDRDELYKLRVVDPETLSRLWDEPERFEALREVARFLGNAFGDSNPIKRWLKLRSDAFQEWETPLNIILDGEPTDAIKHAIFLVMRLEHRELDESYVQKLHRLPLSEYFAALAGIEFEERDRNDFGREINF